MMGTIACGGEDCILGMRRQAAWFDRQGAIAAISRVLAWSDHSRSSRLAPIEAAKGSTDNRERAIL
jgi:hypothetical protein